MASMAARTASAADPLTLAELEFRIAQLPPISRGTHLGGPTLHAARLAALWQADDDVSLAQAFLCSPSS
jgi:hypothetical protein